jgi:ketosteroid isomerase-like protein
VARGAAGTGRRSSVPRRRDPSRWGSAANNRPSARRDDEVVAHEEAQPVLDVGDPPVAGCSSQDGLGTTSTEVPSWIPGPRHSMPRTPIWDNQGMACTVGDTADLADRLRAALTARDLGAFGMLLSDDVRWGSDDHPRACRNRSDVLATFARIMSEGAEGAITELAVGTEGILCGLAVAWPTPSQHPDDRNLFHVYLVRDGRIVEIQRYDDRDSAAEAAGVA